MNRKSQSKKPGLDKSILSNLNNRMSGAVSKFSDSRSLPPLRQQHQLKADDLLQQSLIQRIKQRNKQMAYKKSSKDRTSYNFKLSKNNSRESAFYQTLKPNYPDQNKTREISPIHSNEFRVQNLDNI